MDLKLQDKRVVYDGKKIRLEVHELLDEVTNRTFTREVCVHNGAVVVLPLFDDGSVLLIRSTRYAVGKVLLELPAGTLEKGENPLDCAGRELLEETGYLAGRLKPIGSFFASPGILTEKMYTFAAFQLSKRKQALEVGEDIEVLPTAFEKAIDLIKTGQIEDAKTIATLLMFDRFHRA